MSAGQEPAPENAAREICLAALERRPRTRRDLKERLLRKRIPEEVADAVLDRFVEVGLVDDEAFARALVMSRQRGRPRGVRALAVELRRKGIPDDVAERVLAELVVGETPEEVAARALAPKLRSLAGRPPEEVRRKSQQFLLRRGFDYETVNVVMRGLVATEEDPV